VNRYFVAATVLASTVGCGGKLPAPYKAALQNGAPFELFSLDPVATERNGRSKDGFHEWIVLGKTTIDDHETRDQLVSALEQGVARRRKGVAGCFEPRHGIRVKHEGVDVDFIVCFRCAHVQVFVGKQLSEGIQITDSPQPVFDKALRDAGVPVAEKPK
jgi:hypothetical protein